MTDFAPSARRSNHDTRRAQVTPLLAAGMSVRAISAKTNIPVGAVHRAKRHLEKTVVQGKQCAAAVSFKLPTSYVVKQDIGGVPQDVRRQLSRCTSEPSRVQLGAGYWARRPRQSMDRRQRLVRQHVRRPHDRVAQQARLPEWDQRCRGEAIIAAVNALIRWQR